MIRSDWSLRTRMTLWLGLLLTLIVVAVIAFMIIGVPGSVWLEGRIDRERTKAFHHLDLIADLQKRQLLSWLQEKRYDAHMLGSNPFVGAFVNQLLNPAAPKHLDGAKVAHYLAPNKNAHKTFTRLIIASAKDGKVLFSSPKEAILGADDMPLLRMAILSQNSVIGDVKSRTENTPPLFHIAQPILNPTGIIEAILIIDYNPDNMFKPLLRTGRGLGQSGEAVLVNGAMRILTTLKHPLADGSLAKPMVHRIDALPARMAAAGSEGIVEALDYRGVAVLAAFRHIRISPEWGWGLVVKIDYAEFFAPIQLEIRKAIWTGLVGIIAILLLTGLATGILTKPLRRLSLVATRLADGDLAARSSLRGCDEIGILGHTFDRMADTIQAAIATTEERYRTYVDNAPVGIFVVDAQGCYVDVNRAACNMTGYTHQELTNLSIPSMVPGEMLDEVMQAFCELKDTGRLIKEIALQHKDGAVFPVSLDAVRLSNGHFMGFCSDISVRRAAQDAERESRERLQAILDNSSAAIFLKDHNGRYSLVNRRFKEVCPSPGTEIIGATDREIWGPEVSAALMAADRSVLASGQPLQKEEIVPNASGDTRTYLVVKFPLFDVNGVPQMVGGIATDISERILLEKELTQARKMEAVGTLTGGIAHDFNNILYIIMGNAELGKLKAGAGADIGEFFAEILKAAARASDLVVQMLAFSRRSNLEKQPLAPGPVIRQSLKFMRAAMPANIELQSSITEFAGSILANATQVHQLVMNLMTNAAQAMSECGGEIEVTLDTTSPDHDKAMQPDVATYFRLQIRDTGPGIALSVQEHMFEPFFTTKEVGKGTGLGLSVVHGIVDNHGGTIKVDSTLGQGATFIILLPLIKDIVAIESAIDLDDLPRGRGWILLVDDEPQLRNIGCEMLEKLGYRVESYGNPKVAWERFQQDYDRFDIVVSDQAMPGMTGVQLGQKILAARPDVPFFICSGFSETIDHEKANKLGFRGFFQKPFSMRVLAETLAKNGL